MPSQEFVICKRCRVSWLSAICLSIAFFLFPSTRVTAEQSLIVNGEFEHWDGDVPRGWSVDIGAMTGAKQPVSIVRRIAGPALMLRGDAGTKAWQSVTQELAVDSGGSYRLEFQARSKGVKREGRQYNNCYVGWMSLDNDGKVVGRAIKDISAETGDWKQFMVDYTVPAAAKTTTVSVFLSKTGLVGVKGFSVFPISAAPADQAEVENLLDNGSFEKWTGGAPAGWKVEVGAKNGANAPLSKVASLGNAGLQLSGDARTLAWQSLSQDLEVKPGKTYTIKFQASGEGIVRQGRQYDNCYVGVMHFDGSGQRLDMAIEDLSQVKNWKPIEITFRPPDQAKKASVLIFLSKSGVLKIKDMRVSEAAPARPFR